MDIMKSVRVGVVGAGTVGSGTIEVLLQRADVLARRSGVPIELAGVADLDPERIRAAGVDDARMFEDYTSLTRDPEIDMIVELIGGTRTAEAVIRDAFEHGKAVVTANKALLAEKGDALFDLARTKALPLAFEAAVAGGIPVILAIRDGLICNHFLKLLGIVNGTCNYILSEMIEKGVAFDACLAEAQALGFAEADPTTDIGGFDAGHKLALLSALTFETKVDFDSMHIEGIKGIDLRDVEYAKLLGYTVRLLAVARPVGDTLFLSVHPALLAQDHPLAGVYGSMNAVALEGDIVMESMMYGRGAGKLPTASAVVSDIAAVARALRGLGPGSFWTPPEENAYTLGGMEDYRAHYYLRFEVTDKAGVLGRMTQALGAQGVSIGSMHQHVEDDNEDGQATVVMVTHNAREGDVRAALDVIAAQDYSLAPPVLYRIES